jgi:hypothetical protein
MLVVRRLEDVSNEFSSPDANSPEALERGEMGVIADGVPVEFSPTDLDFLRLQESFPSGTDIALEVQARRLHGHKARGDEENRLHALLAHFADSATHWLHETYPQYSSAEPDRVTLRTEEEATRPGSMGSRIDLLHIDSFPSRPTLGQRILRLCVNINPTDDRVWATAGHFTELLGRFATKHKVPMRSRDEWIAPPQPFVRLFTGEWSGRPSYDAFMLRLHHFLKEDEEYQARAARKLWNFAPGSAWLMFTDSTAYAQLRGRYALEMSFFVPQDSLLLPDEAPLALLEKFGIESRLRRAG